MICWVEIRGLCALTLLTGVTRRGVACWIEKQVVVATAGAECGPGTMLPESTVLLMPLLMRGCVEGAGGVGRLISTELGYKLAPRGLVSLEGTGGGVALGRGAIRCWWPPFGRCLRLYR